MVLSGREFFMGIIRRRIRGEVYPDTKAGKGTASKENTAAGKGADRASMSRCVTPLIITVDISDSMNYPEENPPILRVNQGMAYLKEHLMGDLLTRYAVWICLIAVGKEHAWIVNDFQPVREWVPPVLKAEGLTPMGEGIRLSVDKFRNLRRRFKGSGVSMTQGIMVTMTDGYSTDETDEVIRELHKEAQAGTRGHLSIWCFATPPNADMGFVRSMVIDSDKAVLLQGSQDYRKLFTWIGNSVTAISHSHGPDAQTDRAVEKFK